jgi:hypothetical protein
MSTRYVQIHPKVHPVLGSAIEEFAKRNDLSLNRAVVHLLTLGMKEMERQHGGSILHYLNNISLNDQEIH